MTTYHVLLKAVVNVRVANVEAETPEEAAEAARESCWLTMGSMFRDTRIDMCDEEEWADLPEITIVYTEFGDEVKEALVDVDGDTEYTQSRWIDFDPVTMGGRLA